MCDLRHGVRSIRANSLSSRASNSFCAGGLISIAYLSRRAGAFQTVRAVLFVWNALFLPARFRNKAVPEVLPNGPVFFEVDENAYLAALLIGDKLDSAHDSLSGNHAPSRVRRSTGTWYLGEPRSPAWPTWHRETGAMSGHIVRDAPACRFYPVSARPASMIRAASEVQRHHPIPAPK